MSRPRTPHRRGALACLAAGLLVTAAVAVRAHDPQPTPPRSGAALLTASAAIPAAGYGFSDGISILSLTKAELARELDAVAATTATWLRIPIDWPSVERRRGVFDWSAPDRVVEAARARGLRVLGVISYTPSWARGMFARQTAPPSDATDYGRFAAETAAHYGDAIAAYELWNEPNLAAMFGGKVDPARYAELLISGYAAIKEVRPEVPVISGGLSPDGMAPAKFLRRVYRADAAGSFDAVGLHPYVGAGSPEKTMPKMQAMIDEVRAVLDARGDDTMSIWLTEFGTSSAAGQRTPQRQAEVALAQLSLAARSELIGPCIIYQIRDAGPGTTSDEGLGHLLTYSWQTKPLSESLADPTIEPTGSPTAPTDSPTGSPTDPAGSPTGSPTESSPSPTDSSGAPSDPGSTSTADPTSDSSAASTRRR